MVRTQGDRRPLGIGAARQAARLAPARGADSVRDLMSRKISEHHS